MDENNARVVLLAVGINLCQFDEVRNLEGYKNPLLLSRDSKQPEVVQRFKRGVARSGCDVVSKPPEAKGDCRRNVGVKQDPVVQLTKVRSPATAAFP